MANNDPPPQASTTTDAKGSNSRLNRKILLAWASVIVAFLIAELGVRVLDIGPKTLAPRRFEPRGGVPFTSIDTMNILLPVYQPRAVFSSIYDPAGDANGDLGPDGRVVYRINSLGLRGDAVVVKKPPNVFRVVCLGDSITFGEGVHEEQTYPELLQRILAKELPTMTVEVINAGVQAYGLRECVALFLARCRALEPDVVTLGLFLNDAMDFPETIRLNDEYTRGAKLSALSRFSRVIEIIERNRRSAALQDEYFTEIRRSFDSAKWKKESPLLSVMAETSRTDHFRFVPVLFPVFWDLDGDYPFEDVHERILRDGAANHVSIIDLLDSYRGIPAESLWVHITDHHPNATAQRIAAERIARAILSVPDDVEGNGSRTAQNSP